MLTSGQFKPAGFIQDFNPRNFIAGLQAGNAFTSDLGIPISTNSFAAAAPPPFGGYSGAVPNGGLDVGLAFLSEIQVFLFLEAVQHDQRSNIMQAPKLTMFNGQTATLAVTNTQNFVTGVQAQAILGQVVFTPIVTPTGTGNVTLAITPVVSADRRFVRMTLTPNLTNLASSIVPLFPIVTPIFPTFDGGIPAQPVLFTQFLQTPIISNVTVSTTVIVPDGGTVLLGGLKRLSEGRNEAGPPILSKIPYLDRLFRNVGYSREAESLLMMVTPRIIITEEEERVQTGQTQAAPRIGG
jgi:type II secretory pathway component GspD/PulD (secretin)